MRLFLLLLLFPISAVAQNFDLTTMPKGYSFVSIGEDARSTIQYVRPDGDEYIFEETTHYNDGRIETATIHVNNASQSTFWSIKDRQTVYTPHDCGPSFGECYYTRTNDNGTTKVKTVSRLVGDVRISDEYTWGGNEWLFWNRDCTVYDEYGFWVDYVRTYWDGDTAQGYREQEIENRIDELWQICEPPSAIS